MTATINNQQFFTNTRQLTTKLWEAYEGLKVMQDQWNALDYGNTLMDGSDNNANISAAQIGAVIFDSVNAITTVMNSGVATNLAKLL